MRIIRLIMRRLKAMWRPETIHDEISEEMRFHIEMKTLDLVRNGLPPQEAGRAAVRAFGSAQRAREEGYDVRGGGLPEQLWGDIRFAVRLLRKQWKRTLILIATLGIGLGMNSAVFGVLRSVLLQPLPFGDASRLVVLHQAHGTQLSGVSYPHFEDWRRASHSFTGMAVYSASTATLTGVGDSVVLSGAVASATLFRVLQVSPIRGRLFAEDEDHFTGGVGAVIITDRLWRSRFAARSSILGTALNLDSRFYRVIGIVPARLAFPMQADKVDFWTTVAVDADPAVYGASIPRSRGYPRYDGVIARLRHGVPLESARREMAVIAHNIRRAHPKTTSANDVAVLPALEEVVGSASRTMLLVLYAAVLCLLIVACTNVANILAVDALSRRREFSLRLALGAPFAKLFRQLAVESCLVSLGGAAAAGALAFFALKAIVVVAPFSTPRIEDIHFDAAVLGYILALSLGGGILFGSVSAFSMRSVAVGNSLKTGARGVTRAHSTLSLGSVLIGGQIVLAMLLTCCAGLLVQSFERILHSDRGFNPHGVLTASVSLPVARYHQGSARVLDYYKALLESVRAVPGVQAAAITDVLPLSGLSNSTTVEIAGVPAPGLPASNLRFVDAAYFATLQIPLISGRTFAASDKASTPSCVIVNQAFIRQFLGSRNPFSTKLRLGWGGSTPKQIVGVVGNLRYSATSATTPPEVYVPFPQFPLNDMAIMVRSTSESASSMAALLRAKARQIDPAIPLDRIRTLDEYVLLSSAQNQLLMWLLVGFAAATVLLAAIGLYAALSESVDSRAHEVGIRLALGSSRWHIVSLIVRSVFTLTLAGIVAGAGIATAVSRLLSRWLFEGNASSVGALATAGGLLLLAALAACWAPSHRAAAIDPALLLRLD